MQTNNQPTVDTSRFNPRFVAYAEYHGKTPAQMLAEAKAHAGHRLCDFICWILEGRQAYRKGYPEAYSAGGTLIDQDGFTAFLENLQQPEQGRAD